MSGFIENPQNNGLIPKLSHYWLELPIPEWVSLVWPMRGLLSLISCCRGISFEEGHSRERDYDSKLKILKIEKRIHQFCGVANCTITFRGVGRKLGLTFLGGPQIGNHIGIKSELYDVCSIFENTLRQQDYGRYQLTLPWKDDWIDSSDNRTEKYLFRVTQ